MLPENVAAPSQVNEVLRRVDDVAASPSGLRGVQRYVLDFIEVQRSQVLQSLLVVLACRKFHHRVEWRRLLVDRLDPIRREIIDSTRYLPLLSHFSNHSR